MQRLKGDGNTFAEIADALMAMVLREGASSKQIDVVFDVYRETSIKNTERERRGCQAGNEYRNLQPEHRVRLVQPSEYETAYWLHQRRVEEGKVQTKTQWDNTAGYVRGDLYRDL